MRRKRDPVAGVSIRVDGIDIFVPGDLDQVRHHIEDARHRSERVFLHFEGTLGEAWIDPHRVSVISRRKKTDS